MSSVSYESNGHYGNQLCQYWPSKYLADQIGATLYFRANAAPNYLVSSENGPQFDHRYFPKDQHGIGVRITNSSELEQAVQIYKGKEVSLEVNHDYNENAIFADQYRDYILKLYKIKFQPSKDQITIHLRLGDLAHIYERYKGGYIEFVKTILQKYPDKPVVIVSNDRGSHYNSEMKNAIQNIDPQRNCRIQNSDYITDFNEFRHSTVIVATSSTFTWWAAFLNENLIANHVYLNKEIFRLHDSRRLYLEKKFDNWHIHENEI